MDSQVPGWATARGGEFSFPAQADEVFVITFNEYKTSQTFGDYRLTVRGGDCRPRLAIQTLLNANIAGISWPNSAAACALNRPHLSTPGMTS